MARLIQRPTLRNVQGAVGLLSAHNPRCATRAADWSAYRLVSVVYRSYIQAEPVLTCSRLASTPLQITLATVRPYLSLPLVSSLAGSPRHKTRSAFFDSTPKRMLVSGASILASRMRIAFRPGTAKSSVSPSTMLITVPVRLAPDVAKDSNIATARTLVLWITDARLILLWLTKVSFQFKNSGTGDRL